MARILSICALAGVLLSGAYSAAAQPASPGADKQFKERLKAGSDQFKARVEEAARQIDNSPRLKGLSPAERNDLVEFVVGNMLFATLHEMGHAHVQEMGLPVLGREEDAADAYAVIALLKVGTDVSHNVLIQAAKGWFLSDARNQKEGYPLAFYDEHGLDRQRAYQIVCLMVGSDPETFSDLADQVKMPEDRQGTCQGDYSNASWSWTKALAPYLRSPGQERVKYPFVYGKPEGSLDIFERAFRAAGVLERITDHAGKYTWHKPFVIEADTCGESGAQWDLQQHKIIFCYELSDEFAALYKSHGEDTLMSLSPPQGYRPSVPLGFR